MLPFDRSAITYEEERNQNIFKEARQCRNIDPSYSLPAVIHHPLSSAYKNAATDPYFSWDKAIAGSDTHWALASICDIWRWSFSIVDGVFLRWKNSVRCYENDHDVNRLASNSLWLDCSSLYMQRLYLIHRLIATMIYGEESFCMTRKGWSICWNTRIWKILVLCWKKCLIHVGSCCTTESNEHTVDILHTWFYWILFSLISIHT